MNGEKFNLNNLIDLMDDEYFIKVYDSFKYVNNSGCGYIIITNKRFFLLSYYNKKEYDNVALDVCSIKDISRIKLEYGLKVKGEQVFWSIFSLVISFGLLTLGILSLIDAKVFLALTFLFCFFSTLAIAILLFIFKYRKVFFLEIYYRNNNEKFLSLASKNYLSNFTKTNMVFPSQDTFKMLKELSLEIQKAKEIKPIKTKFFQEEVKTSVSKINTDEPVELVVSESSL